MGRKIFIHHDGALGDVLLSLPAIEALKETGDSIHLAGRGDVADFLKNIEYVRHGYRSGSRMFLPLFMEGPDSGIGEFLSGFEMLCLFSADESSQVAVNLRLFRPDTVVIKTIPPPGSRMHVSDFRLGQVASKEVCIASACRLAIPPKCEEAAVALLLEGGYDFRRRLVAIHPGSGSRKKCWPLANFRELMNRLGQTEDCFFIILSGPAETGKTQAEIDVATRNQERRLLHVSGSDLAVVAALLSLCHLYIGNDSGITHLASSVTSGRIIALFGPTDPRAWGPRDDALIIASDMECVPCEAFVPGGRSHRPPPDCEIGCLSRITVQSVLDACRLALARTVPTPEAGAWFPRSF